MPMPYRNLTQKVIGHDQRALLDNLRRQLDAAGADGNSRDLGEAMQALGCRNEHETMLALIDSLMHELGHSVAC
jgi:hypothetical protein